MNQHDGNERTWQKYNTVSYVKVNQNTENKNNVTKCLVLRHYTDTLLQNCIFKLNKF